MLRQTLSAAVLVGLAAAARAETIEVRMLNRGPHGTMAYDPEFVAIRPGDTVQFRVGDRSHNAAAIDAMAPEGFSGFKGKIDQEVAVVFERPGYYGVKCSPHYGMGMVMLVRVGDAAMPPDLLGHDLPEPARKRFGEILARAAGRQP